LLLFGLCRRLVRLEGKQQVDHLVQFGNAFLMIAFGKPEKAAY